MRIMSDQEVAHLIAEARMALNIGEQTALGVCQRVPDLGHSLQVARAALASYEARRSDLMARYTQMQFRTELTTLRARVQVLEEELAAYERARSDMMARYTRMQFRAEQAEERAEDGRSENERLHQKINAWADLWDVTEGPLVGDRLRLYMESVQSLRAEQTESQLANAPGGEHGPR